MLISIFSLLMAPDPLSFKTTDAGSTASQRSKESMLLKKLLEECSLTENTIQMSCAQHIPKYYHKINTELKCGYSNLLSITITKTMETRG